MSSEYFDVGHLNKEQRRIADVILTVTGAKYGGSCTAFYTPEQWVARGESYGLTSKLIVVHDGGDLAPYCNLDYEYLHGYETLTEALCNIGYILEACTCWYSAVYAEH